MRPHRFIGPFDLSAKELELKKSDQVRQIRNVLRARAGDTICLGDGRGNEAEGEVKEIGRERILVQIKNARKNKNEPEKNVTLYLAVLKRENFEFAAQKATEIGVAKIVPVQTRRTVKTEIRGERVKKIVLEAAEQSGRGVVPEVCAPMKFEDAIKKAGTGGSVYFFEASGKREGIGKEKEASVFVGPEGGWAEEEVALAKSGGAKIISLCRLTLRAETAAIIGSYLIVSPPSSSG